MSHVGETFDKYWHVDFHVYFFLSFAFKLDFVEAKKFHYLMQLNILRNETFQVSNILALCFI